MRPDPLTTVIDSIVRLTEPGSPVMPTATLADTGLDSLDTMEVMLDLEEAYPDLDLETFEPGLGNTVQGVAEEIARRIENRDARQ